jgi:hypothetical protein
MTGPRLTDKHVDTGIKIYACYDGRGKRRTGFYGNPLEAQLFCRREWHVDELIVHGIPKNPRVAANPESNT